MHAFAQGTGAFAMHHTNLMDAVGLALGEVGGQEIADLGGAEGVQIQLIGDGQGHGFQLVVRHEGLWRGRKQAGKRIDERSVWHHALCAQSFASDHDGLRC